ncbi:hypothetical protein [Leptolyngbya sp. KIOST-1]|uniref:hypothetical protein n=1 Tax=Leptolyngbya sp. KIOST-1 TaxID=1229172 RepID=UPI000564C792|nr:hypothetical protein [Leptolyngbya sp. KIOST-1]
MALHEFRKIVKAAIAEQRHNLGELTGSGFGSDPDTLCNHIRYLRAGSLGQLFWDEPWKQVVTDVADHVGIDWTALLDGRRWQQLDTCEIENAVVVKVFQEMFDRLPPDQREQVILEMQRHSDDPSLAGLLLAGGAIAAAKASGFGVYLMASTVLGGLTSALGLTLPFAVYMGMSQMIALALGPVGWVALLGGLAFTLNQPNWQRLTLAVVYVSVIRHGSGKER